MVVSELKNLRISVIGAARSGIAVAKLLKSKGAEVFVSDHQPKEKLVESINVLESSAIHFEAGGHTERIFDSEIMVLSPGVPSNAKIVLEAESKGIRIISELELASWFSSAPIVAITGSNGKTTTTTLIGKILEDAGKKHVVAGNIGNAFSSVVSELSKESTAVLEVSSFQLDHIEMFHPYISMILNITEDHMDRYEHSIERYATSKARIFKNQTGADILIYNSDDAWTCKMVSQAKCRRIPFSLKESFDDGAFVQDKNLVTRLDGIQHEIIPVNEISIKGEHNLMNAMAATLAAQLLGVEVSCIKATLQAFTGVEHRLEFVREFKGVRYINDSKATNVDSVWYALLAFDRPIVLLLGGRDKGNDYSRLSQAVKENVRAIVAIGESASKVHESFHSIVPTTIAGSMEEAMENARKVAHQGDIVLLSPACASFDWFDNYEHRGRVFKELVRKLR